MNRRAMHGAKIWKIIPSLIGGCSILCRQRNNLPSLCSRHSILISSALKLLHLTRSRRDQTPQYPLNCFLAFFRITLSRFTFSLSDAVNPSNSDWFSSFELNKLSQSKSLPESLVLLVSIDTLSSVSSSVRSTAPIPSDISRLACRHWISAVISTGTNSIVAWSISCKKSSAVIILEKYKLFTLSSNDVLGV